MKLGDYERSKMIQCVDFKIWDLKFKRDVRETTYQERYDNYLELGDYERL